jgi:hypothetical protein
MNLHGVSEITGARRKGILPLTIILANDDTWSSVELMLPTSV